MTETGKEAFLYWVKTAIPEIYEEDVNYNEMLTRAKNYLDGLYNDLHTATYHFTEMGTTFENMRNYIIAMTEPTFVEDFNPHAVEEFRTAFINKNVETTSDLNNLFFGLWN